MENGQYVKSRVERAGPNPRPADGAKVPGLRQAGDVVDLNYPPFFVDCVEDAVPSGPQAPQIWRAVRERLRRPRLTGELADGIPERRDTDVIVAEEARCLVQARISQLT